MKLILDTPQITDGSRLLTGGAGHIVYDRDAVPLGPFDAEPLELWQLLGGTIGTSGPDMRAGAAAWLLGALEGAGVDVRAFDRGAVRLLIGDAGIPEAQIVAGWIVRAEHVEPGRLSMPGYRRTPAERLLDALGQAGVRLGRYDVHLPGFLAEDYGPRPVLAVAGWLGRTGRRGAHG